MLDTTKNRLYKNKSIFTLIILSLLIIYGCGENNVTNNNGHDPTIDSLYIGTDTTLDVMTWNIEHFPKQGDATVETVIEIIRELDLDMIVMQEIESEAAFDEIVEALEAWEGYRSTGAAYDINLAVIYNTEHLTVDNINNIFSDDWWAFPRTPQVIDCYYNGENYVVINNHLKAGGGSENEERRLAASESLKVYMDDNYPNKRVILLGDLNDSLTDSESENVFWQFISDSTNYQFADMAIAKGSISRWSYPSWPSHLDHILITNELFEAWESGSTMTLLLDDYYEDYQYTVSDHRPVLIKLDTDL
ncbi:MAG: endonuclease/exonuclease/phosphatase family protein [Candidatus Cloacimonetes bacterium]|nr:endonuclease/exonuclease/phosphatase family protein [Candidatus Cloacimonadota bacterium]MBS3766597.1 endonuclease/exonuclease/phosphatase family protein [Candidatus Cloacimonadota bacterium]